MHAAAIAAELGIERILCPRAGGVLSALGLCASDRRRDTSRTVMLADEELSREAIAAEVDDLIAGLAGEGLEGAVPEVVYEMRYAGQAFELPVPGPPDAEPADLVERFERAHEDLYGHRDPQGSVVLVHIGLAMVAPGPRPIPAAAAGAPPVEGSRRIRFDGEWATTPVLRGEPAAGSEAEGPVVFELPEATFVVPPGWSARVDEAGTIVAEADG
jgi:N-methylhydantoinase A